MVEIELHPTFNPSKIQAKIIDNNPIIVMKYGWGAFRIGITIYWKDRFNEKFRKVYHDLLFVPLKQATLNLILTVKTLIFFEHIDTLSFS